MTIGFIDPGNWATNIAGGADFRYDLLWVITLSTLMLVLIQNMGARLGIATGKPLGVNMSEHFPNPVSAPLGGMTIAACAANDVVELPGGAIGFRLLFGFPLWLGAFITVFLEVFFIVSQRYHRLKRTILGLGMLGAVVMPHNIFLHSNVIQSRKWGTTEEEKKRFIKFGKTDTVTAMALRRVINSSMIIVAASVFFKHGVHGDSLQQASDT